MNRRRKTSLKAETGIVLRNRYAFQHIAHGGWPQAVSLFRARASERPLARASERPLARASEMPLARASEMPLAGACEMPLAKSSGLLHLVTRSMKIYYS